MARGVMLTLKERLHGAAAEGNAGVFRRILSEDPHFLRRIEVGSLNHTPLHVASFHGHDDIVDVILAENRALAGVLDSRGWSPLHLASAQGRFVTVSKLLECNAEMCLAGDGGGRNPLHLASIGGHTQVLEALIETSPFPRYELLTAKDGRGNTILHLAAQSRQFETVKSLLDIIKRWGREDMALRALNTITEAEYTTLDIIQENTHFFRDHSEILDMFTAAGAKTASEVRWREEQLRRRDAWMVVASLLATMAFQVAVNPPGGSWQDDKPPQQAGFSIWARNNAYAYKLFIWINGLGFTASVSALVFVVFGLHALNRSMEFLLHVMMGVSLFAISFVYATAIVAVTPANLKTQNFVRVASAWLAVCLFSVFYHLYKKAPRSWQRFKSSFQATSSTSGAEPGNRAYRGTFFV